ncbi:MAG: galactose-1-epimerase, partial [Oceanobacillus sp.]|nr:galactose-1-epimerase [Oceanobacillus sp.]
EDGMELKEGFSEKYLGVCFETQASPASLHYPGFPSVILKAGEQYKKQTVFSFSIVR